jgi:hypothetical protein
MLTKDLEGSISELSTRELELVKLLIFNYNNSSITDEMKAGYGQALHHVFHILCIATIPDINLSPAIEQQIDKLLEAIYTFDNEQK